MGSVKNILKKVFGDCNLGRLDVFRHPRMLHNFRGAFNGQRFRQRIFFDLLYCFPIKAIVETGTYRGKTTTLFKATFLTVYTAEIHPRYYCYSKLRFLLNRENIQFFQGDSRIFLRGLSENDSVCKDDVFFYLDAHWGEELPLREELDIIFLNWRKPVVMIDDFQVPDSDYGFDDYGSGKTLNLSYIDSIVTAHKLAVFFPSVNSSAETGAKRGSVVLCREISSAKINAIITTLVRYTYSHECAD